MEYCSSNKCPSIFHGVLIKHANYDSFMTSHLYSPLVVLLVCFHVVVCPKPTGFGICVESCAAGLVCGPGMKCCSNGCGHVCTNATDCAVSVLWERTI